LSGDSILRDMHETHFPESTALHSAAYDDDTQELTVRLRTDRTYVYRDVEGWVYDALVSADSAGAYYNQHVKDHYAFAEIVAIHGAPTLPRPFGRMLPSRRPLHPSRSGRARRQHSRRARRG
jgi:hypothetical protein